MTFINDKYLSIYKKLNSKLQIYSDEFEDNEDLINRIEHLIDIHLEELKKYKNQIEENSLILEAQFEEISRTYEELTTVLDISKVVFANKDPRMSLDLIVKRVKDSIKFKNIVIGEFNDLSNNNFYFKPLYLEMNDLNFDKIEGILNLFVSEKDAKVILKEKDEDNNSFLLLPIKSKLKLWGFILLYGKSDNSFFFASEKRIMESITEQVAFGFDTMDYLNDKINQQLINEQMKLAKEIQTSLLPDEIPEFENIDIASYYHSAFEVGGDYYDVIKLSDHEVFCILADVSGKGVPAALIMSSFRAVIRNRVETGEKLENLVKYINNYLANNIPNDRFITGVFVYLNSKNKNVKVINTGHNSVPIIIDEKYLLANSDGLPLGIMENSDYTQEEYNYNKEFFITLYTDGVNEARDTEKNEFGMERLENLIKLKKQEKANVIVNSIIESVENFSQGVSQHDDTTLLIIKGN